MSVMDLLFLWHANDPIPEQKQYSKMSTGWQIVILPNTRVQHMHMTWRWMVLGGVLFDHFWTERWDEMRPKNEDYGRYRRSLERVMADMREG